MYGLGNALRGGFMGVGLSLAVGAFAASNPVVTNMFTADPAGLVYNDTMYIFTGHDEAPAGHEGYIMNDWHIFSSGDMDTWVDRGAVLSIKSFKWARGSAWASQTIERNGKFYWYVTVHDGRDFAVGVAVADHPAGPYKDAIGKALITSDMTAANSGVNYDIDPTVFIDDDGQAYIYWGNGAVMGYRLKENMVELQGSMFNVTPPSFTEAPYVHKRNGYYFLTYAYGWEERIGQATMKSPTGPVSNSKVIVGYNKNSNTSHQAFVEFHNQWYYIYHTGAIGGSFRRALCVDYAYYENDSTIANITMTDAGVKKVDHAPIRDGVYRIKARHSGLSLEDAASAVIQMDSEESESQLWALRRIDGYTYTLRNIETGKYLSFGKGNLLDSARTVDAENRIVIENFNVDDGYRLYADTASEYLGDVLNISTEAGMPLVVWKQTGTQNQSFKFEYMGDESAYSSSSVEVAPESSSFEAVSSSSAEITSLVVAPVNLGARVVGISRADGLRFSQAADYALMNLHGMVVARGHAARVAVKDLAPGAYVVRLGGHIQKIELR
ncbi:family 43 glycosylhydrolase [uncultured Fibrobacter sp.]|uniref:family 43 glycosylhydrolase n=1 Tax=uncultured Fibrobacter sp. TaxID=261512 RepID=UPI0025FADB16|nr:family 43 glycosylhydrolase [uncultured Fibrobacter sp.]